MRSVLVVCAVLISTDAALNGVYQWLFDTDENLTHAPSNNEQSREFYANETAPPETTMQGLEVDHVDDKGNEGAADVDVKRNEGAVKFPILFNPTTTTTRRPITTKTTTTTSTEPTTESDDLLGGRYTIEQMDQFVKELEILNQKTVKTKVIGQSWNNASIVAVEIQHSVHSGGTIFIDAGMNGDEWEAVTLAICITKFMMTGTNVAHLMWLRWAIVLVVNPDGYNKAFEVNEYHLNVHESGKCPGVNIARNFMVPKVEEDQEECRRHTGASAFTEKESSAIRDYVTDLGDVKLYINLHSDIRGLIRYPCGQNDSSMAENVQNVIRDLCPKDSMYVVDHTCYGDDGMIDITLENTPIDWAFKQMKINHAIELSMLKYLDGWSRLQTECFVFLEGIKYAVLQVQLTDKDVGAAFYRDCCGGHARRIITNFGLLFTISCYVVMFK